MNLAKKIQFFSPEALKPYENNARVHSDEQIRKIASSIREFGFANPILVDKKKGVIAGHGRLEAAKRLGLKEIPVVVLDYLSEAQKRAFILADNRIAEDATWDQELLTQELEELSEFDFDLGSIGFSDEELENLIGEIDFKEPKAGKSDPYNYNEESGEDGEENGGENAGTIYTKKIKPPVYEPKGDKPEISELFDRTKTDELAKEITKAKLPADIKTFLLEAAQRHTLFNYERIAEFYAHADAETQDLMERSALVIIDFKKAIENGFVVMTKEIAEAYSNEPEDE